MKGNSKVLWGEGLFLRPQHFQQQDVYHEHRLKTISQILQPDAWGIVELECDNDGLRNGVLRLLKLFVIFRDSEIIRAPQEDKLPAVVDLNALPTDQVSFTFYLGIPRLSAYGKNVSYNDDEAHALPKRYEHKQEELHDLFTGSLSTKVSLLDRQIVWLSEHEPRDGHETVAAIRIRRASLGGFELDPRYIPPSLRISSSDFLMSELRRLLDALQAKVSALHGHHREPNRHIIEFRSGDVSSFWLLHTASHAFASLSHYLHQPAYHPERLFEQLLSLAGALLTYSKQFSLADLPHYRHDQAGVCFEKLFIMIRELLDTVISARYFSIALHEKKSGYFYGQLDSGKLNQDSTLYIAVSANMPALELAEQVPIRFKVGSPEDVDKLVLSAMPGVKIVHAPQVPSAIPVRPDNLYFSLDRKSPLYESMMQAQSISIYVPNGLDDLQLELMAVTA